jgi:hypothetical protein
MKKELKYGEPVLTEDQCADLVDATFEEWETSRSARTQKSRPKTEAGA